MEGLYYICKWLCNNDLLLWGAYMQIIHTGDHAMATIEWITTKLEDLFDKSRNITPQKDHVTCQQVVGRDPLMFQVLQC